MARLPENQNTFSTLELFQNDETARAPEPNPVPAVIAAGYDIAPEIDSAPSAPQTLPGRGPEVLYNTSSPEVVDVNDTVEQPEASTLGKAASPKRTKFAFAALALFLLTSIVIGLGVELRKSRGKYSSSPATARCVSIYNKDKFYTYRARPSAGPDPVNTTRPTAPANPVNSSVTQQILNDTSLAAVNMANGDRYLFFQDPKGVIQQAIHTISEGQWIVNTNPIGISDARYLTPMAADTQEQNGGIILHLYYISTSNHLSSWTYVEGDWQPGEDLSNYTTSPSTRQLSIISTNSTGIVPANETSNQSLLLYENLRGNVTALLRVARVANLTWNGAACVSGLSLDANTSSGPCLSTESQWIDISSNNNSGPRSEFSPIYYNTTTDSMTLYQKNSSNVNQTFRSIETFSSTLSELNPGNRLSAPFATAQFDPFDQDNQTDLSGVVLICDDNCSSFLSIEYMSYTNASHGVFSSGEPFAISNQVKDVDNGGFAESDLVLVSGASIAVWINGTQLISFNTHGGPLDPVPFGSFPYKRLAIINMANQTGSYLYHQINGTTLAEEQYIADLNQWVTSSYITILNS